MAGILISPSEGPNFHGYFKFGRSRYGIFFKCENDEYYLKNCPCNF
jgi:hypothetical protein